MQKNNQSSWQFKDADDKLRRWEEALERGLLSVEDAARRIKQLRGERASLLRRKAELEKNSRSASKIRPIPTALMATFVREMQERQRKSATRRNF
jgi:hypothetical protein